MSSSILPPLTPISSLTQPRGVVLRDELSGRPAHLLLKVEGLRFLYATPESAALDYATVSRVAPLLASIAAEETAGGSSVERAWHAAQAREKTLQLIAQLRALVEANLVAREFEIANASAIRLLRALIKLYGEGSVETLRAYLALAESSLGLGAARATATSSFLFAATSILLRATKGDGPRLDAITSRAKLAEGRLALLEGKPEVARAALARAVFHGACVAGADALAVAMPFFHLGRYFAGEGREVQALAAWEKTVEAVSLHVRGVESAFQTASGFRAPPPSHAEDAAAAPSPLGKLRVIEDAEITESLNFILAERVARLGDNNTSVADVRVALASVHALAGRDDAALSAATPAVSVYAAALGAEHPSTAAARALAEAARERLH